MLMKSLTLPTTGARLAQQADAAVAALWLRITQLYKALRNRRAIARLTEQDDHLLADIGLTRQDVRDAVIQSIWRDPTTLLRHRASAARARGPARDTLAVRSGEG